MNGFGVLNTALPSAVETLHQLIQQSPDAVVLFRSTGYRFVTHGADTAHLKPLHEAPVRKNMKFEMKRDFADSIFSVASGPDV